MNYQSAFIRLAAMSSIDVARTIIRRFPLLYDLTEPAYAQIVTSVWQGRGAAVPAPAPFKREVIRRTAQEHRLRVLIETGTFMGDTVMTLSRHFDRLVTVELSPELYAKAVRYTSNRRNIELLMGDSAELLPRILTDLHAPALFWLDAHYSEGVTALGDTVSPIAAELDLILGHDVKGHVILIDDAREFRDSARTGYPGIEVVADAARKHDYSMSERDDIFFLLPN
jgi:hypothetical protein